MIDYFKFIVTAAVLLLVVGIVIFVCGKKRGDNRRWMTVGFFIGISGLALPAVLQGLDFLTPLAFFLLVYHSLYRILFIPSSDQGLNWTVFLCGALAGIGYFIRAFL